jgi:orotidine-5'-phosphate decarboxylase
MTELILSLDVLDRKRAVKIAESCAPFIDAIKVGYPLVLSTGLTIVEDLAGLALPLIADFKVADIPNTNRLICEAVFSAGFDAVIAHGFVGADAARTCVEVAHNHSGAAYIVAEMSHPGATEFFHDGVAERLARLAVACRADGIIAPATRPGTKTASASLISRTARTVRSSGSPGPMPTPTSIQAASPMTSQTGFAGAIISPLPSVRERATWSETTSRKIPRRCIVSTARWRVPRRTQSTTIRPLTSSARTPSTASRSRDPPTKAASIGPAPLRTSAASPQMT